MGFNDAPTDFAQMLPEDQREGTRWVTKAAEQGGPSEKLFRLKSVTFTWREGYIRVIRSGRQASKIRSWSDDGVVYRREDS